MNPPADDRSPMAVAAAWASRIITVSIEMVVPGLVGMWVDQMLGTTILFGVLGFALGMVVAIWHLLRMTARLQNGPKRDDSSEGPSP